jgi:hypothetical protein
MARLPDSSPCFSFSNLMRGNRHRQITCIVHAKLAGALEQDFAVTVDCGSRNLPGVRTGVSRSPGSQLCRAVLAGAVRARWQCSSGTQPPRGRSPVKQCAHRFVPSRPPAPAHSSHVASAADPAPSARRRLAAAIFLRLVASLDRASVPGHRLTGARECSFLWRTGALRRDAPVDLSRSVPARGDTVRGPPRRELHGWRTVQSPY